MENLRRNLLLFCYQLRYHHKGKKKLLLASLAYAEKDAAEKFPKDIATMEQSLKRLEEQEQKYSAELDAALTEYAGLRAQAQGFDPVQLL